MHIIKAHDFKEVQALELGYGPFLPPLMTVYLYSLNSTLIDTGQRNMRRAVLEWVDSKKPQRILLTHHHEDHSGNAAVISNRYNIPVLGHSLTVESMQKPSRIFPYQHFVWGAAERMEMSECNEDIDLGNYRLTPIHTPGHSKDHCVYLEKNRGWLFSGDLYLADRIKFFRADERILDQIHSLQKILTYEFDTIFCCHHPRLTEGHDHMKAKLQFLEDFYGSVKLLWQQGNNATEIMKRAKLKEDWMVRLICMGNVSMKNMILSTISCLENERAFSE